MVLDVLQIQKTNLFFTKSNIVLDDHPWKLFADEFVHYLSVFEYNRQASYHFNAETAFEKLTPTSMVLVEFSDNTIIAGSTWGNRKKEMFLSEERLVGGIPWRSIKDNAYNFEPNATVTTY